MQAGVVDCLLIRICIVIIQVNVQKLKKNNRTGYSVLRIKKICLTFFMKTQLVLTELKLGNQFYKSLAFLIFNEIKYYKEKLQKEHFCKNVSG